MASSVRRLEQALQMWEDFCYLGALHTRLIAVLDFRRTWMQSAAGVYGPERHWKELRRYLLSFRGDNFDLDRFVNLELWKVLKVSVLARFPPMLAAWTAYSRHVFHLSAELQSLLELTSVSRLRWKDIPWPYESFVITLERPIVADDGIVFDCILVSRKIYHQDPGPRPIDLAFYVLPQNLDDAPHLDWRTRTRFERMVTLGKYRELRQELEPFQVQFAPVRTEGRNLNLPYGAVGFDPDVQIVDVLDDVPKQPASASTVQAIDVALRVTVSLCAYLSTLPPNSGSIVVESSTPADPEIKGITKGAQICHVLSGYSLTPDERRVLGPVETLRQFRQLSPHWRRGHFRREPGQGQNPYAKRCVWVRPTLVRKDLLHPGLQVGGAQVEVE